MHNFILIKTLLGIPPENKIKWPKTELKPDDITFRFLEEGHVMELIEFGPEPKRIVSLFFGPGDFVIRCHPEYSKLQSLDKGVTQSLTHSHVMTTLRKFPQTSGHYRKVRELYEEKVARRINMLHAMTPPERFRELKTRQPWVLSLVEEEDIASYLGIPTSMLRELKRNG